MSAAEDFYYSQDVNFSGEQVNCYTSNDEQFVHYQTAQYADNRAPITTVVEIPQHYSAEYHVKEGYQNECFVHSKGPDCQTIQHCDDTLNRQEHQYQYGRTSTAAYAYDVAFNSQNLIFQQSNDLLLPDNNYLHFSDNVDFPNFSEPQGQHLNDYVSRNDFTSVLRGYDPSKSVGPIRNDVQSSKRPSNTVKRNLPDGADLYSESEIKKILSLPITLGGKIVPRNLCERIAYELRARNITRKQFFKNVLGRSTKTFYGMLRSSSDWDKLGRTRREQYKKMKEWLDMSEDQKKAAVKQEIKDEITRTVFTQAQREALKRHFEKFPEARKRELLGLADQLQLPWKVVAKYFTNQRTMRKHQRNQQ